MSATQQRFGAPDAKLRSRRSFGDAHAWDADRRRPPLLDDQAGEPSLAHQPLDALAADPFAVVDGQVGPDPRRAVDAAAFLVQLTDPFGQPRILARTGPDRPLRPGVVAGPADLEHAAHDRDRVRWSSPAAMNR